MAAGEDRSIGPRAVAPGGVAPKRRRGVGYAKLGAIVLAACLLAACGGGGSGAAPAGSAQCDQASQKLWLREYMRNAYFWAGQSPDPAPEPYADVPAYFVALRFAGGAGVPADRWSYITDSAAFQRFFAEGRTLGYGVSVNGLEGQLPLKVRHVEPLSPAATLGVKRGDVILALNGRTAAELLAANDFAALNAANTGDRLEIRLDSGGQIRDLTVSAAEYALTPVLASGVLTLPGGRRVGYVALKDFITQAEAPLLAALNGFVDLGLTELVLDLRYNGGGRVSTANVLASAIAGVSQRGKVFTHLNHNARHSGRNSTYLLDGNRPGFSRVIVLSGARTCSASELLINGLKPHVTVSTLGAGSCGKPFGFNPVASCGSTFSAVTFEALNAAGEGRYYDGIAATCPLAEDFGGVPGDPGEKLTAGAMQLLSGGTCPAPAAAAEARRQAQAAVQRLRRSAPEPGEWRGMLAD